MLPVIAVASVFFSACSSTKAKVEQESELSVVNTTVALTPGESLCASQVERTVSEVMGTPFALVDDSEISPDACNFVAKSDDEVIVSVSVKATENGDSLKAVVETVGATKIESDIPNEVFLTPTPDVLGQRVVVRRGGTSVVVGVQGIADEDELNRALLDLARAFSGLLPDTPFDSDVTVAAVDCGRVDPGAIGAAMDIEPELVVVSQLPGQAGCEVNLTTQPLGAAVSVEPGEASAESLDGRGGTTTADGRTVELKSDPVEGLGDGAVWLSGGDGAPTGELYVLIGNRLVRAVSSGGDSDDQRKSWAVAVAKVAGPALVE